MTNANKSFKILAIKGQYFILYDNIEKKNLLKLKNKYQDILRQNLSILQQYLNRENISQVLYFNNSRVFDKYINKK